MGEAAIKLSDYNENISKNLKDKDIFSEYRLEKNEIADDEPVQTKIRIPVFSEGDKMSLDDCDLVHKSEEGYVVRKYKLSFFLNKEQIIISNYAYESAYPFRDKRAIVQIECYWYEINEEFKVISPPYFQMKNRFEGLRPVQENRNGKWFYVNDNHKRVTSIEFESASPFSEDGTAVVTNIGGSYFVDTEISTISRKYISATNLVNGIGLVRFNLDKVRQVWCYVKLVQRDGNIHIEELFPERYFYEAEMFDEKGIAQVRENKRTSVINIKGETIAVFIVNSYGWYDNSNKQVQKNKPATIDVVYEEIENKPKVSFLNASIIALWFIITILSVLKTPA